MTNYLDRREVGSNKHTVINSLFNCVSEWCHQSFRHRLFFADSHPPVHLTLIIALAGCTAYPPGSLEHIYLYPLSTHSPLPHTTPHPSRALWMLPFAGAQYVVPNPISIHPVLAYETLVKLKYSNRVKNSVFIIYSLRFYHLKL
jgi:hypothetical protein